MANAIEILINARDNASAPLDRATLSVASLAKGVLASVAAFAAVQLSMQAVSAAAIGASRQFADEVEQLDRLRNITGLTNEQLQVFRRGLERNGLSADQLGLALRFFQNQLAGSRKEMVALGITSMGTFDALVQLRRALDGAATDAERTEIAAKTLGMRNVELAQTITNTASNYNRELLPALDHGAIMSAEFQDKMRDLDDTLDDFADTMRSFKIEMAEAFGPALKGAVEFLNTLNSIKSTMQEVKDAGYAARGMMDPAMLMGAHARDRGMISAHGDIAGQIVPGGPAWNLGMSTQLPGVSAEILRGYSFGTEGAALGRRDSATQPLMDLVKSMREAAPAADALNKGLLDLTKAQQQAADVAMQAGFQIQGSITTAVVSLVTGAQNIGQVFRTLIMDIFASIVEAIASYFAKQAAGWIVSGIGLLTGQPGIVAAGGAIRGSSMSPAGGNTFVIQSIDSKSALDSLVSPTGSLRRANDRVRDVALAGAL